MRHQRQRVWEVLEKYGIHDLPIDYEELLFAKNVKLSNYEVGAETIKSLGLESLTKEKQGFSVKSKLGSYVFYRKGIATPDKNHVIAHEFGHIEEGHNDHAQSALSVTPEQEQAAEEYVYEMAPTPALYMAGIHTIEDIQRVTKLDEDAAQKILVRISEYKSREFTEEERQVYKRFDAFITRERRRKMRSKLRKAWLPLIAGATAATLISSIVFFSVFQNKQNSLPAGITSVTDPVTTSPAPAFVDQPAVTDLPSASLDNTQIVYWLDGGDVYHLNRNCQHLRTKKDSLIRSGTIEESGKVRACKSCS